MYIIKVKMKKKVVSLGVIIIVVILFALFIILSKNHNVKVDVKVIKCIGSKSTLYVQKGCHYCERQEKMFGDQINSIDVVDCWYEREKCIEQGITATPTWIIYGNKYIGVHSIEELKNLTGC